MFERYRHDALQPLNISGQNMRLKIRIGINLAKSSHNRDEDDVHSQYCGTRRVIHSPKPQRNLKVALLLHVPHQRHCPSLFPKR